MMYSEKTEKINNTTDINSPLMEHVEIEHSASSVRPTAQRIRFAVSNLIQASLRLVKYVREVTPSAVLAVVHGSHENASSALHRRQRCQPKKVFLNSVFVRTEN